MYVILTTYPAHASGNVGDLLITHSAIQMLKALKPSCEVVCFFRGEQLTSRLGLINRARAIIMPGFAVRNELYPKTYQFTDQLGDIKVPIIPLGAGWKSFPGDEADLAAFVYPDETKDFLQFLSRQVSRFACRDDFTYKAFASHGIENCLLTGDCAWYDLPSLGRPMKQPDDVKRLVFTTPHDKLFKGQAKALASLLARRFPKAQRICVYHGVPLPHELEIGRRAKDYGFNSVYASHDVANIEFYKDCDLHIGYRLHAHLAFLRKRVPSILMCEDGRGLGAIASLGIGGVRAWQRASATGTVANYRRLAGNLVSKALASPRMAVWCRTVDCEAAPLDVLNALLTESLDKKFVNLAPACEKIDRTYEVAMRPFLESIP